MVQLVRWLNGIVNELSNSYEDRSTLSSVIDKIEASVVVVQSTVCRQCVNFCKRLSTDIS